MKRPLVLLLLLSLAAAGPTVRAQSGAPAEERPRVHRAVNLADGNPSRGRRAFVDLRCHACHRVAEDPVLPDYPGAWDGPVLHGLGKQPREVVAWRIVARSDVTSDGAFETPMAESASAMTSGQLADLVAYLRNPRGGRTSGH